MLACICISLIKITFLFIIINFVKCRFDPKISFVSILQSVTIAPVGNHLLVSNYKQVI